MGKGRDSYSINAREELIVGVILYAEFALAIAASIR